MQINNRTYEDPGTGAIFLTPSQARTRLCVFITGVDSEGLSKAAWTLPFRSGLQAADYTIVGKNYGDPLSGWTSNTQRTTGAGGILASGYWSNSWDFDQFASYLK